MRYLSGVAKGVKTAIAGIEISSGVLNAMITVSDCESGFCNDLRTYLFWLEMASLGADTFTQQQIRQSANKALKSADNSVSKEIKEELARVGGKVDDVFSSTRFIVKTEEELKAYLETLSDLPKGVTYNGSIYRSLSKNAIDNYGAVPNQISDYSVDNAWGRYDLQGEAALYCSETLSGNKTEIMYYANKYGQKWEDYFTYEYNNITITNMLDLTDDLVRQKLGINESMLKRVKELSDETVEKKYNYLFTNVLGSWAREKYNGLIVPGTRGGNYKNIILFKQDIVNNTIGSSIPSPIKK
ncbi:RES domain-containing protein [Capnocytophaga cynodegmi]|uniref:RES domain-containing protein n=1 Tax=Capnocytophaga cynodegmi TaxID=28189 RepID=UPI00385CDF06